MTVHFNLAFSTENVGPVVPFLYQLIKHWHQFPRTMIISWKFNARFAYFPVIDCQLFSEKNAEHVSIQLDYLRLIRTTAVTAFNTYGFKFIPLPMFFFNFQFEYKFNYHF